MDKSQLSLRFKNFAELECKDSSKLYEFLSVNVSEDDELLELCSEIPSGQPVPNLLLGAVHYLLLKGEEHCLREYYPSINKQARNIDDETFVYFKGFCKSFREEIVTLLKSKLVQTNEVRRCGYLYPVFSYIYSRVEKPLALIEIGTSAGLQLLWDKYRYSYGTDVTYGDEDSSVQIISEFKGENPPPFLSDIPPVASKVGVDLHINDLRNSEDYLWLKSLIWPEHQDRMELFESAVRCFKENPVELIEGDGVALLTGLVDTIPEDSVICIFHTHVANQMSEDIKYTLLEKIKKIGSQRDIFHIYNNMWDRKLHLDYFMDGLKYNETVGDTDGHGRWFEWDIQ
ncbi:DUF2332 domain-containing protein [Peribacillus sp. NPDC097675]|uniref:DUF2332 domain-containing protein n=1 Tax=Peribacillus sp. NPDC097675 TaxID=3390618 RepID=UPI003D015885